MDDLYKTLLKCTEEEINCDDKHIREAFLSENPYHNWMACKASGLSCKEKWIPALIQNTTRNTEKNDPDVNSIAIWALAKIGGKEVDSFWKIASKSEQEDKRRVAADLIGEMGQEEGLSTLIDLLNDDSDDVSAWAALSLAKLGKVSLQVLLNSLSETVSLRKAIFCIDAIAKIAPKEFQEIVRPAIIKKEPLLRKELEKAILEISS